MENHMQRNSTTKERIGRQTKQEPHAKENSNKGGTTKKKKTKTRCRKKEKLVSKNKKNKTKEELQTNKEQIKL